MELGELELQILKILRRLGEAPPRDIHRELRKERSVAYTSVTTTLYRLVDKKLLVARKVSRKKVFYSLNEGGRAYDEAVGSFVDRLVDAFGPAVVPHLIERADALGPDEAAAMRRRIEAAKRR